MCVLRGVVKDLSNTKQVFGPERQVVVLSTIRTLCAPGDSGRVRNFELVSAALEKLSKEESHNLIAEMSHMNHTDNFSIVLALLCYKRLLLSESRCRKKLFSQERKVNAFVPSECGLDVDTSMLVAHGIHQMFWIDLESSNWVFLPVFQYVLELLLDRRSPKVLPPHLLYCLLQIMFQFFFYYEQPLQEICRSAVSGVLPSELTEDKAFDLDSLLWKITIQLRKILSRCESGTTFSSFLYRESGFADMFVNEVVEIVKAMDNESSILIYLKQFPRFKHWKLTYWTTNKVQVLMYLLSVPGSPFYTPRIIRQASRRACNELYPVSFLLDSLV